MAHEPQALLQQIFDQQTLILAVLSSPKKEELSQKLTIRPIQVQGQLHYQVTEIKNNQAFHQNFNPEACVEMLQMRLLAFKQTMLYTQTADYQILSSKKGHVTILEKPPSKAPLSLLHNRQKQYLLEEGIPIPFLVALGVMSATGKVYPQKQDKFRQINRFVEMVEDILPHLDRTRPLYIVDFGCGKAYLTFALYHYLKIIQGFDVRLRGLDLKTDAIEQCQALADQLGYSQDLTFVIEDINRYQSSDPVDLVVSLHACDTATDAALEKAIRWQAKVILCVPCCQHELFNQVQNTALDPLLKQGILKERFAALATDAVRVELLEVMGYRAQILEFIAVEHTPKNLLIRAIRQPNESRSAEAWKSYQAFKHALQITPSLERRFADELANL